MVKVTLVLLRSEGRVRCCGEDDFGSEGMVLW